MIHAWSVPALGVKQDSIPGFVRDSWFKAEKTGSYVGQCSELCGKDHAFMPIEVRVVTAEEYTEWVGSQLAGESTKESVGSVEPGTIDVLPQTDVVAVKPSAISMSSQEEVK